MLGFTHDSRKSNSRANFYADDQYQPIVIHNGTAKQKPFPQPSKPQKIITKTHSNQVKTHSNQVKTHSNQRPQSLKQTEVRRRQLGAENREWNTQAVPMDKKLNQGTFDQNMKKDSLAAQERRLRAEHKIASINKEHSEEVKSHHRGIMSKEEELHYKKMEAVTAEKDKQIEKLRQMIEKERAEKERADREYELKKRKIDEERKQLIEIEREIQRRGPKAAKEIKEQLRVIQPEVYPVSDRAKCRPDRREYQQRPSNNFVEVTQSQSLANQRNRLRQEQLSYLVEQREKNHQQYHRNTMGYTPTLIPLLSKASYKIISTHISTLVELFIDEMLEEQVHLLEEIELVQQADRQREKDREMVRDYATKLEDFVDEVEIIEDRVGRYSNMHFQDIYRLPAQEQSKNTSHGFEYRANLYQKLDCGSLTGDRIEQVKSRADRFKRFVSSFDEYKPANMRMFEACTEQMIEQALMRLAKELDNGSGEFVDIVFRSQFE